MNSIEKAAIIECPTNPEESFFHYSDSDIWREGFRFGALSDAARDHHQKGLYSETEVRELLQAFKVTMAFAKDFGLPCDILELFEKNKKK